MSKLLFRIFFLMFLSIATLHAQTVQAVKPTQPIQPIQPIQAIQSGQTSQPGQTGQPSQLGQPGQTVRPVQTVNEYRLAQGDSIRIMVYQSPDMTLDTRISENGTITYPLIGSINIGGLTISAAEGKIARALEDGHFVRQPQVNIVLLQIIGNQISVLGQVTRPGTYPLVTFGMRLTQMLATAGGLSPAGSSRVIVSGVRNDKPFNVTIDINSIYLDGQRDNDMVLAGGDTIFVPKAATFYIYGQVKTPGQYVIEPNMSVEQALAAGGGLTLRGSMSRIDIKRADSSGKTTEHRTSLEEQLRPGDIIFVRESIF